MSHLLNRGTTMQDGFMTDPTLLGSLDGQQYLVLRPASHVAKFYAAEQSTMRKKLPSSITHPNTGHVTLRGFYEPSRVHELKSTLAAWATRQEPIEVRVDRVDGFPTPFQVLIARLQRSDSLIDAYSSLTTRLDDADFCRIGELPLEEWVFHLSLIYCNSLSEADWRKTHTENQRDVEDHPHEILTQAEFVWYENGVERTEVLPFGGPAPQTF